MRPFHYIFIAFLCFAMACAEPSNDESNISTSSHCKTKSYHENGAKKEVLCVGAEADTLREYYPSGKLKIQGLQVGELRDGTWKSWFESGQQWSEKRYDMGKEVGKYAVFHPNGGIYIQGQYREGNKVSSWYFYDQDGKLVKEVNFDEVD